MVATGGDFRYLLLILLPTAFLLLVQPLLLLAAVPQLGVNLLSEWGSTVSPLYHYSAPVIAIAITASILGVGVFQRAVALPLAEPYWAPES